ncbi:hypothetical protein RQP54_14925 [Curvibacter sp. APW13]|uniref:hypothetical protein n=1 Tax=Curvibacter sp. APW13 TaxID=3077236 RepID=UPI0028E083EE|nr:hypothetical protein [Curvibacter sp. APW13]MDT8992163.1 hypothetical protein [Curvibacter sp. APW13]
MDISVAVQFAAEDDPAAQCVGADVLFGDAMVEASAVVVRLLPGAPGASSVSVTVRRPVDEPVVTVYLRAGCRTAVSRKYVLLSELVSEALPPIRTPDPAAIALPKLSQPAPAAPVASVKAPEKRTRPVRAEPTPSTASGQAFAEPSGANPDTSQARSKKAPVLRAPDGHRLAEQPTVAQRSGPRLKLTPLDLSKDWDPSLRFSNELSALADAPDTAQRAQAQALWRAIQASPEDILRESAQRVALEKELSELTRMSQANQQSIAELTLALRKAQDGRMANPALFVLLALLVVCGAVLAVRMRRPDGGGGPWWMGRGNEAADSGLRPDPLSNRDWAPSSAPIAPTGTGPVEQNTASAAAGVAAEAAASTGVGPGGVSGPAASKQAEVSFRPSDFANSVTGALRSINTQEMLDVRQQAEFFLALGQLDEAASLLQSALSHSSESNPHIYLDLLALMHRLGRRDEYQNVRESFMARYTGLVPAFGDFEQPSSGLLDYPGIAHALAEAWPSRYALEYIEQCLVREPADPADHGFELEAFRELLLLHAMLAHMQPTAPEPGRSRPAFRSLPASERPVAGALRSGGRTTVTTLDLDLS